MVNKFTISDTKNKVKSLLALRGISQVEIARETGAGRSMVSLVVSRQRTSRRIERVIARRLKIPVNDLFPRRRTK